MNAKSTLVELISNESFVNRENATSVLVHTFFVEIHYTNHFTWSGQSFLRTSKKWFRKGSAESFTTSQVVTHIEIIVNIQWRRSTWFFVMLSLYFTAADT